MNGRESVVTCYSKGYIKPHATQ